MPDSNINRCQIYKHGTGFSFCLKTLLNVLGSKTAWSTVDLPRQYPACSVRNGESIMGWTRAGVNKPFEDLIGTQSKEIVRLLFGSSLSFQDFGIATAKAFLQILGIMRWCKEEERKPHNQDFMAVPAWMISSGHIESDPGAFPSFVFWRAAADFAAVKLSEH